MNDIPLTVVRPRYIEQPSIETRNISGLSEASGSGVETGVTDTGYILPGPIAGTGLYGFPGVELYTESGGGLLATILFYDESGTLITSTQVGSLGSTGAASSVGYALSAGSPTNSGTGGTYYSAWSALSTPIPSGTVGYLCGGSSTAMSADSGSAGAGTISTYIELGNSGSVDSSIHTMTCNMSPGSGAFPWLTVTHASAPCNTTYTAPGLINQVRVKVVTTLATSEANPWTVGFTEMRSTS